MEVPRSQTLDYGGSVAISCTVNACPTALWIWKKDGALMNFDGFRRVDKGDSIEVYTNEHYSFNHLGICSHL